MNSRSDTACYAVLVDAGGAHDVSKAPANRLTASQVSKRTDYHKSNLLQYSQSFKKDLQHSNGGPRAHHRQRGKGSNGGLSPQCGEELCLLGTASNQTFLVQFCTPRQEDNRDLACSLHLPLLLMRQPHRCRGGRTEQGSPGSAIVYKIPVVFLLNFHSM